MKPGPGTELQLGGGGAETGQGLCARGAPVVLGWTWAEGSWLGKYIRLRTYVWEI